MTLLKSSIAVVLLSSATLLAQDPVKVDATHYKVVLENASVRILSVNYAAGAKSPVHQHPDAIIVPLANAKTRFTTADGKNEDRDLASGSAMYAPAGVHSVTNLGSAFSGILVEFKGAAPGKATLPTARAGMAMKVLAEGPHGMAYTVVADPSFQEPSGTTHEYDQVVIATGPSQIALNIAGKPAKTTWARGDVQFIGRGVAHDAKNSGAKPVEMIIVAIK